VVDAGGEIDSLANSPSSLEKAGVFENYSWFTVLFFDFVTGYAEE
jgi:hypothetical protein